jgi:hypothetical protein
MASISQTKKHYFFKVDKYTLGLVGLGLVSKLKQRH